MTLIIDFLAKNDVPWFPIILEITSKQIEDPYIKGIFKMDKRLLPIKHKLYAHDKQDKKTSNTYKSYLPQYDDFWKCDGSVIRKRQQLYFQEDCDIEFNAIWIDTTNHPQVDIDCPLETITDPELKAFLQTVIDTAPSYPSMTKPYGKHCIFQWDENDKPALDKFMYKFKNSDGTINNGIDFLCGQGAYANINIQVDNFNEPLQPWDNEYFTKEYLFIETVGAKKTNTTTQASIKQPINADIYDKFWDYFSLIDNRILGNYQGWLNCACIHKNIAGDADYERFDKFCSNFDGYDETKNKSQYDGINEPRSGWKKLYEYAYVCNADEKLATDEKFKDPAFSLTKFLNIKSMTPIDADILEAFENIDDYNAKKQKEIKKKYNDELQRVEHDLYKKRKFYFEKYHAKILDPLCFIRVYQNNVSTYKKQQLNDAYENLPDKFIETWRKDVYIKTYEKMDFLPKPLVCPSDIYNKFKGFRIETVNVKPADDYSILLEQIKLLTNDEAGYDYMIKYLAHLVQRPGELPGVMIMFRSIKQGVGKNLFFEKLAETMIGRDFYVNTADIDKLVGRFPVIANKFIVCLDEAHGKDTFANSNKIKNLITADKFTMETKGIDAFDIRNLARLFAFTNGNNSLPVEANDRRMVIFECNCTKVGDHKYFNALAGALENDSVIKAFYNYLMTIEITGWRPHVDRPKTELYNDLQMANMGIDKKFMFHLYENSEKDSVIELQSSEFYDKFVYYCQEEENIQHNRIMTHTKFGLLIKSQFKECIEKIKLNGVMKYSIDLNKLNIYLTELGFLNEEAVPL